MARWRAIQNKTANFYVIEITMQSLEITPRAKLPPGLPSWARNSKVRPILARDMPGLVGIYKRQCRHLEISISLSERPAAARPSARPPRLSWAWVGGMSALVSATTNLTIAIITSYVGASGVVALAGHRAGHAGIHSPVIDGIGGAAGILIGTNAGAGEGDRALRTARITVLLSALTAEAWVSLPRPSRRRGSDHSATILQFWQSGRPTIGPLGRSSDFTGWTTALLRRGKGRSACDGRLPALSPVQRSRSLVALPRSGSEQVSSHLHGHEPWHD
jgi:hypothetical protein